MTIPLRRQFEELHDAVASIYTEEDTIRAAVLKTLDYLQSVLKQPDSELEHYRQEVFARLQAQTKLLEGSDIEHAKSVNNIRRLAVSLRENSVG